MENRVEEKEQEQEEDDDVPQLNASTLAVLQEFLKEQQKVEEAEAEGGEFGMVQEDWRMSQFWYEASTSSTVADEIYFLSRRLQSEDSSSSPSPSPIACIACPSLYSQLKKSYPDLPVRILEFDERFSKFGDDFVFYDYNRPTDVPPTLREACQIVVADPPYLSRECLEKTVQTMKYLSKSPDTSPMMILTGAVQRENISELLQARPCRFRPLHSNKLGNEFMLFTTYDPQERLGGWEGDL
ncbi:EEF1A lysine methyltransferase 1 [Marchantia polymorpha subsp. ruderalis]|uniref:Protein-lysine N-methyltransferase MARPO_0207s0006 n=1 Tax=Marchantia polymorpha TaxID=3197 RepID=A0A2R6W0B5_MARPO|nr:hypothetical protein MARPO_0207s0006 [Marchantia polymorpha]BBN03583.1 hypothetical protein Mp_2g24680 [Marchantia polymorpha subsp. ruderalis]|eukprot:PTQ27296.1 hypothetical protein MARPO_0207s0006 [Marchantia polymorpha]